MIKNDSFADEDQEAYDKSCDAPRQDSVYRSLSFTEFLKKYLVCHMCSPHFHGHSIAWEKDDDGHLTIRDTQGGNTVLVDGASGNFEGIRNYFRNVNPILPVEIARLDDKSIVDKGILDYVDSNLGSRGAGIVTKVYANGIQAIDKLADAFKSVAGH